MPHFLFIVVSCVVTVKKSLPRAHAPDAEQMNKGSRETQTPERIQFLQFILQQQSSSSNKSKGAEESSPHRNSASHHKNRRNKPSSTSVSRPLSFALAPSNADHPDAPMGRILSPELNGTIRFSNIPPLNFAAAGVGRGLDPVSSSRIITPRSSLSTGSTPRRDVASPISPSSSYGFLTSPRSAFAPSARSTASTGLSSYRSTLSMYAAPPPLFFASRDLYRAIFSRPTAFVFYSSLRQVTARQPVNKGQIDKTSRFYAITSRFANAQTRSSKNDFNCCDHRTNFNNI